MHHIKRTQSEDQRNLCPTTSSPTMTVFFDGHRVRFRWLLCVTIVVIFFFIAVQFILAAYLYTPLKLGDTVNWSPNDKKLKQSATFTNNQIRKDDLANSNLNYDDEDLTNSNLNSIRTSDQLQPHLAANSNSLKQSSSILNNNNLATNNNNQLVNNNNDKQQLLLNFNELNFDLQCTLNNETISAINRAKSQQCKKELMTTWCKIQNNQLYKSYLPRYCHLSDGQFGDYLGCYRDQQKRRLLRDVMKRFADNSHVNCQNFCMKNGYVFAGVQYSNECHCGDDLPPVGQKIDENYCNMSCPQNPNEKCGGYFALNLFRTGLKKRKQTEPIPESVDRDIRIAFVFTVNGRAFRQLKRLIRNLYSPKHLYLIHVDSRQEYLYREVSKLKNSLPNLRVMTTRLSTIWGGASLLRVHKAAIRELFNMSFEWDYFINLSESDFPIKPLSNLEAFLAANRGKNFVKSHGQDTHKFIMKQGLDRTFYECDNRMWRLGHRQLPNGIRLDGGSDWVALSSEFCRYITFENNELLEGLSILYNYTLLPSESYFHTVLQNSKFCDTIIDNNLHVTNWKRKQGCKCQYKHIVDWCGCSPNDFRDEDWTKITVTQEKPLYFARKFEPTVNQQIINQLERWMNNNQRHGPIETSPAYNRYWQNIYSNQDTLSINNESDIFMTFAKVLAVQAVHNFETNCFKSQSNHQQQSYSLVETLQRNQINVLDGHVYFENDEFKGILVSWTLLTDHKYYTYELLAEPVQYQTIVSQTGPIKRLISLKVCSDFDPKEEIFRNFGCLLNPNSEPVVSHKWSAAYENFTVTFVWLDPSLTIAGAYEVRVDTPLDSEQLTIHYQHKPPMKRPLRPGVWKLLMLHNQSIVAETRFFVVPFMFFNGQPVTQHNVEQLNGKSNNYADHQWTDIEELLNVNRQRLASSSQMSYIANENAKRYGAELFTWCDNLIKEFWTIRDVCAKRTTQQLSCKNFVKHDTCKSTIWSSFSPDPKSEIVV